MQRAVHSLLLLLLLCSAASATAQVNLSATRLQLHTSESSPAPAWMAWRAFHASMSAYSESEPEEVANLLMRRAGLEPAEVDVLLFEGLTYLADLDKIDADLLDEIEARRNSFSPRNPGRRGAATSGQPQRIDVTQLVRDSARVDGTIDRVKQDRQVALRDHLVALADSIGYWRLSRISRFIDTEIAPNVVILEVPRPDLPEERADAMPRELP